MKKVCLTAIVHLFLICAAFAQTDKRAWIELQKVRDHYAHLENYSVSLTYKVFKGHTSPEMMEIEQGRFETSPQGSRYVLGDLELIRNGKYFLSVDKANREMDVAPLTDQKTMPVFIDFGQMDSMMRKYDMVSQLPMLEGTYGLRFDFSKNLFAEFERIDIRYLPSGDLTKAVLYYRQTADMYGNEEVFKPRLEVDYLQHNYRAEFARDHFSEAKYFTMNDGKIDPKPNYRTYKIYSLL